MNIWVIMFAAGLLTYLIRLSFILMFGRFTLPEWLLRALHYVPPAVFSAIIFPEVFLQDGTLDMTLSNERLIAGLAATLAAWKSRSVLLTVFTGMAVLYLVRFL